MSTKRQIQLWFRIWDSEYEGYFLSLCTAASPHPAHPLEGTDARHPTALLSPKPRSLVRGFFLAVETGPEEQERAASFSLDLTLPHAGVLSRVWTLLCRSAPANGY